MFKNFLVGSLGALLVFVLGSATFTGAQEVARWVTLQTSAGVEIGSAANSWLTVRLTDGSSYLAPSVDVVEDAAETAGGSGPMIMSIRRDTAASSADATGNNATVNTDANGYLWTRSADPCSALAKTHLPVDIVTATTTELTPSLAGASNHYYICSIDLHTNAANNVALVDDDSDGCGSPTAGVAGGTTAAEGWNFGANGGRTLGNGGASVAKTNGTNRVLCIVTSAATQLSGTISVVAAP